MKQNLHNSAKDKTFPYLRFGFLCGVNFDTKPHPERKLCFHGKRIWGNIAFNGGDVKQAMAPLRVRRLSRKSMCLSIDLSESEQEVFNI